MSRIKREEFSLAATEEWLKKLREEGGSKPRTTIEKAARSYVEYVFRGGPLRGTERPVARNVA